MQSDETGTLKEYVRQFAESDSRVEKEVDAKKLTVIEQFMGVDTMKGYARVSGYSQNKTFYAGAGNDTVYAGGGDDILYGEAGDDRLYGENGDDILIGGTGNDTLYGDTGNDTYVFHRGDGEDIIFDYESSETSGREDKIVFGEEITQEMEDLYAGQSSMDADEPKSLGTDEGAAIADYTEADIDHMVHLLVQDMSENRTDAISDSDIFTDRSTDTGNVQLWSES